MKYILAPSCTRQNKTLRSTAARSQFSFLGEWSLGGLESRVAVSAGCLQRVLWRGFVAATA
jgi:hypothetical protein